jgi:CRP-like cAMP-binding protein
VLIEENCPSDSVFIITKGFVEIALRRPGGHDVVVTTIGPGQYVGEIETYRGKNAIATVRAGYLPVEALELERHEFMKLVSESDTTRQALEATIAQRERENIQARESEQ